MEEKGGTRKGWEGGLPWMCTKVTSLMVDCIFGFPCNYCIYTHTPFVWPNRSLKLVKPVLT